jgi:hypothetical protein
VIELLWQEARDMYPDQWLLVEYHSSRVEGDRKFIDDVEVIRTLSDDNEATKELFRCENGRQIVFHTKNEQIVVGMVRNYTRRLSQ